MADQSKGPRKPRGSKVVPVKGTGIRQYNPEVREAVGLQDRLLKDLNHEELVELAATYLYEGYDGLRTKYGLTRGEVLTLLSTPSWFQIVKQAASAMRAGVLTQAMVALPRLTKILEEKAGQSPAVTDAVEAIRVVKEVFMEVGGIAQVAVKEGMIEPALLAQDELTSLQRLKDHMNSLVDAGVVLETPREKNNGSNGSHGSNGHNRAA